MSLQNKDLTQDLENIDKIIELKDFEIDIKRLSKKYKHLNKDINKLKKIFMSPALIKQQIITNSRKCTNTGCALKSFYKLRKIRSFDLKTTRDFRIIFFIMEKKIYLQEIYCKKEKESEDFDRYKKYCEYSLKG